MVKYLAVLAAAAAFFTFCVLAIDYNAGRERERTLFDQSDRGR
jgi:hypothetical protein